ncbi:MAG: histidine kinase [Xanthomonadales bacterium]|nr:histidine kinase [Xanthomonadales bacterium]
MSRGVYPPSFCHWRLALGIVAVTQVSVLLVGLGRYQGIGWQWLSVTSAYAQSLALFCAGVVCISRAWVHRLPARDAWLATWVLALLAAVAFSYGCGVVGTVLGFGPGRVMLATFMLKSTLAVGLVFAALLRYLFIRSQWQNELIAQADARVQALQARIRPHFLFNSLNTIASLVGDNPEAAERATEDLADLFRGSMRRADRLIPLEEELELARKYLDMEQRRLGERLRVDWRVAELPGDVAVLPLVVQPLLENAVTHGIQARESGGKISVYGRPETGQLVITISNPLPENREDESADRPGNGMALINIRRRLELAHGDRASLVTHSDDDRYFAILTLPLD